MCSEWAGYQVCAYVDRFVFCSIVNHSRRGVATKLDRQRYGVCVVLVQISNASAIRSEMSNKNAWLSWHVSIDMLSLVHTSFHVWLCCSEHKSTQAIEYGKGWVHTHRQYYKNAQCKLEFVFNCKFSLTVRKRYAHWRHLMPFKFDMRSTWFSVYDRKKALQPINIVK